VGVVYALVVVEVAAVQCFADAVVAAAAVVADIAEIEQDMEIDVDLGVDTVVVEVGQG
jgi:hypothetical protein